MPLPFFGRHFIQVGTMRGSRGGGRDPRVGSNVLMWINTRAGWGGGLLWEKIYKKGAIWCILSVLIA